MIHLIPGGGLERRKQIRGKASPEGMGAEGTRGDREETRDRSTGCEESFQGSVFVFNSLLNAPSNRLTA